MLHHSTTLLQGVNTKGGRIQLHLDVIIRIMGMGSWRSSKPKAFTVGLTNAKASRDVHDESLNLNMQ